MGGHRGAGGTPSSNRQKNWKEVEEGLLCPSSEFELPAFSRMKTHQNRRQNGPIKRENAENEEIHPKAERNGNRVAEQTFSNLNNAETRTVGTGLVK
jgi:hypothetical protein